MVDSCESVGFMNLTEYEDSIARRFKEIDCKIKPIISNYYIYGGKTAWVSDVAKLVALFLDELVFPLSESTIENVKSLTQYLYVLPEIVEFWLKDVSFKTVPMFEFCRRGFESQIQGSKRLIMNTIVPDAAVLNECLDVLAVMCNLNPLAAEWSSTLFSEIAAILYKGYQANLDSPTSLSHYMFKSRCKALGELIKLISKEKLIASLKDSLLEECLLKIIVSHSSLQEEKRQSSYSLLVRIFGAIIQDPFTNQMNKENSDGYPTVELTTLLFSDSKIVEPLIKMVQEDLISTDLTTRSQVLSFLSSMVQFRSEPIIASLFLDRKVRPSGILLESLTQWKKMFFRSDMSKNENLTCSVPEKSQWYDWKLDKNSIISFLFTVLTDEISDEANKHNVYALLLDLSKATEGRIIDLWDPKGKIISHMETMLTATKVDRMCIEFICQTYLIIRGCAISEGINYSC
ncbi:HCL674Cp [Eremothecium sinecaudum]|uniref:HCL674Cp n=1 Tax=Eremothecium sinecaudum TaxID=45286 RepID=A0A109UYH2_9SACH|nr:HCL674Cp [Eremothecium sinecaudum]AMD19477.1 HCL674Cp [Eremothecium sinecaudum]